MKTRDNAPRAVRVTAGVCCPRVCPGRTIPRPRCLAHTVNPRLWSSVLGSPHLFTVRRRGSPLHWASQWGRVRRPPSYPASEQSTSTARSGAAQPR